MRLAAGARNERHAAESSRRRHHRRRRRHCARGLFRRIGLAAVVGRLDARAVVDASWLALAGRADAKARLRLRQRRQRDRDLSAGQNNPSPIGRSPTASPPRSETSSTTTARSTSRTHGNNTITEYPKGSTTPSVTLSTGINGPISVAAIRKVTSRSASLRSQTILEFPAGSSSPTVTITLLTYPEGLAFDARGICTRLGTRKQRLRRSREQVPTPAERLRRSGHHRGPERRPRDRFESATSMLGDQTNHVINIYAPGATTPSRTISTCRARSVQVRAGQERKEVLRRRLLSTVRLMIYDYATGSQTRHDLDRAAVSVGRLARSAGEIRAMTVSLGKAAEQPRFERKGLVVAPT